MNFLQSIKNNNQKFFVLGAGISGIAATKLLLKNNFDVILYDDKPEDLLAKFKESNLCLSNNFSTSFGFKLEVLDKKIGAMVLSPGVSSNHYLIELAKKNNIRIISEIELASYFLPHGLTVGVTGTNGKSTTTMMLTSILSHAGYNAFALGNVGISLCDFILNNNVKEKLAFVIELSSFQLECTKNLKLDAAIFLNLSNDHTDRYLTMQEYFLAKKNILTLLKKNTKAFIHDSLRSYFKQDEYGSLIWFNGLDAQSYGTLSLVKEKHNLHNAQAAGLCANYLGIPDNKIIEGIKNYTPLPHRCENVGTKHGITFIDDSKATNIICTKNALDAFNAPIHLFLGGIDKNEDFSCLSTKNYNKIKGYYIFGSSKEKIASDLRDEKNLFLVDNLSQAVECAFKKSSSGDIFLLSPGCASYDQYENYTKRGAHFKKLFMEL